MIFTKNVIDLMQKPYSAITIASNHVLEYNTKIEYVFIESAFDTITFDLCHVNNLLLQQR